MSCGSVKRLCVLADQIAPAIVEEADATKGLISFRSPLAQAILGARPGDIIEAPEPLGEIEIIKIV